MTLSSLIFGSIINTRCAKDQIEWKSRNLNAENATKFKFLMKPFGIFSFHVITPQNIIKIHFEAINYPVPSSLALCFRSEAIFKLNKTFFALNWCIFDGILWWRKNGWTYVRTQYEKRKNFNEFCKCNL
jgi:hypothetical protein